MNDPDNNRNNNRANDLTMGGSRGLVGGSQVMAGISGHTEVGRAPTYHTILGSPSASLRLARTNPPSTQTSSGTSTRTALASHMEAAAQDPRPSDNGGIDGGSIDYTKIRQEVLLVIEKAITGHDLNNVEVDFLTDAPKDLVLDILRLAHRYGLGTVLKLNFYSLCINSFEK